ncbi:hypothetical protein G6F53_014303 [Rhizopus delemar]|nr:hypothetical protein G6F53_014303 [Rhizopus delemar]
MGPIEPVKPLLEAEHLQSACPVLECPAASPTGPAPADLARTLPVIALSPDGRPSWRRPPPTPEIYRAVCMS